MDRMNKVKDQVASVKGLMVGNIEKILGRGEKLEMLVQKSERLSISAVKFKHETKELHCRMWKQNLKWTIGLGFSCILVLVIIIYSATKK